MHFKFFYSYEVRGRSPPVNVQRRLARAVDRRVDPRTSTLTRSSDLHGRRRAHGAQRQRGRPHAVDSTLLGLREFKKVLYFTVRVWSWTGTGMTTVKW